MSAPIEEHEIRAALLAILDTELDRDSAILEEFRIERGGSRIDVAVIDEELVGYEIKSDKDNFSRFANQIHAYNRVFDRIHLVCGASQAELAGSVIPSWWGLIVAERDEGGRVRLSIYRDAAVNLKQNAFSLASLLWREEALAALASFEISACPPKQSTAHVLWGRVAQSLSVEAIRTVVAKSLLKRQAVYSDLAT